MTKNSITKIKIVKETVRNLNNLDKGKYGFGVLQEDCEDIVNEFLAQIKKHLVKGDRVVINGFGVFQPNEKQERKGRHPQTGEVITFPPVKSVSFYLSSMLKDALNGRGEE